jgi:hypothetical protein
MTTAGMKEELKMEVIARRPTGNPDSELITMADLRVSHHNRWKEGRSQGRNRSNSPGNLKDVMMMGAAGNLLLAPITGEMVAEEEAEDFNYVVV